MRNNDDKPKREPPQNGKQNNDGQAQLQAANPPFIELRGHTGPIESANFSPDGRKIVTVNSPSWDYNTARSVKAAVIRIWDAETDFSCFVSLNPLFAKGLEKFNRLCRCIWLYGGIRQNPVIFMYLKFDGNQKG